MDIGNLSDADKYLLYGLLLKKKRSPAQEKKIFHIMRSSLDLDGRIEAILDLQEDGSQRSPHRRDRAGRSEQAAGGGKRAGALVVDVYPELTRLLKKSSLKRRLIFTRIGESFDTVHLLRKLETRLIVLNETLPDEELGHFFEICNAIQPGIKVIFLSSPPRRLPADSQFRRAVRFVPKPLNISRLEETAWELLELN
jgi:hypothetical protein